MGAEAALFVLDEGDGEGRGGAAAIGVFIETRHDVAVEVIAQAYIEGSDIVGEVGGCGGGFWGALAACDVFFAS